MEKTESTTDYTANGVDLGAGEITIITVIDTETKTVTSYQIKSYPQIVEAVAAEVKAHNEAPTLPDWTKHSPHEGLQCACSGTNGYVPRNHPSGLGGQMVAGSLKRQLDPGESTPGTITVDSRGNGEAVAIKLEEMGLKVTRVYPRGCWGPAPCTQESCE